MRRKSLLALALFALVFSTPAPAQQHQYDAKPASVTVPIPPRAITIDDYFQIRDVAQPEMSPDGQWVAYAVRTKMLKEDKNEQRLWMASTHGGDAIPMTAEGASSSHPRWSPDGKYLAFLSSRNAGKSQVWLLNRLGGEGVRLTETAQGVNDFEWSPDSTRLVLILQDPKPEDVEAAKDKDKDKPAPKPKTPLPFVIDRLQFKEDTVGYLDRRRTHLYVFDVAAKSLTQVTSGDFDDENPAWSPDGTSLAFASNRAMPDPDAAYSSDIWVVSASNTDKGGHPTKITSTPGRHSSPAWSPNGKWIAYETELDPHLYYYNTRHLAVVPSSGGAPKVLTLSLERSVRELRFSPDGSAIYFIVEDDGLQTLDRIPVGGGEVIRPLAGRVNVSYYSLGKDGSISAQISSVDRPDEIFHLAADAKDPVRLTKTNDALLSQLRLASAEYVHFKSKDGTPVAGYIYKPLDYVTGKKFPAILSPHGGPVSQYNSGFNHLFQLYAANGYAVLLPNPRGSSGYGQKFTSAIYADWGNKDFHDDMAIVDYAVAQGIADPGKMGVGGWSYGGISTDFIITQTQRFKAAISGAGVALISSFYGHDHYRLEYDIELGYPWEKKEVWERISPFYRVANITTPTLFMGGDIDWNVPILGSEQMYQALKSLGRTTELVVYPGEYHGFTTPSHLKDRLERYLAWYAHFVKGEPTPASPPAQPAPAPKSGE
jgi:dipeptidyl aminopeptidase/acylaminoacyl peptidase